MSYAQIGSCPQCGAPIYAPSVWGGIIPPPPMYSCGCSRQSAPITWTGRLHTTEVTNEQRELDELRALLDDYRAPGEDYTDTLGRLLEEREALRAAARDFIAKVERGEARSRRSYAAFKAALGEASP